MTNIRKHQGPTICFPFPSLQKKFQNCIKEQWKNCEYCCVSSLDNLLYLITFMNVSIFGKHLIFIILNISFDLLRYTFVYCKSDELKFYFLSFG